MGKAVQQPLTLLPPLVDALLLALPSLSHMWRWLGTMSRASPKPSSQGVPSLSYREL